MSHIQLDLRTTARNAYLAAAAAKLSDFHFTCGEDDQPHRLRLHTKDFDGTFEFREETVNDCERLRIISVTIAAGGTRPINCGIRGESMEMEFQQVFAPIVKTFRKLSLTTASQGIDLIRKAFTAGSCEALNEAKLADIKIGLNNRGQRQIAAELVTQNAILDLQLVEQRVLDASYGHSKHTVDVSCATKNGLGLSLPCESARIFLCAFHAYPEIAKIGWVSLGSLVRKINEVSSEGDAAAEFAQVKTQLRNTLLFHFTDQAPLNPSEIRSKDVLIHARPGMEPGVDLQIYRAEKLDATSGKVTDTTLPDGGHGLLNLKLNHDLIFKTTEIIRWLEDGQGSCFIEADAGPLCLTPRAAVLHGLFSWELTGDEVTMQTIKPLKLMPPEYEEVPGLCENERGWSLQRPIWDLPDGEYRLPGFWKASKDLEALLALYQKTFAKCLDQNVVTTLLDNLRCRTRPIKQTGAVGRFR